MIYAGYADEDGADHRGWLLGHFMPPADPRHTTGVDIKWGVHPAGAQRAEWVTGDTRTTAVVLVSGRFRIDLRDRAVVLDRPGAYLVFSGEDHSRTAEEDSVVLCVRWPSVPGY